MNCRTNDSRGPWTAFMGYFGTPLQIGPRHVGRGLWHTAQGAGLWQTLREIFLWIRSG